MIKQNVEKLQKDFDLTYTYTRSLGPIIGYFMAGLREGRIFGIRDCDERVLVPPPEFDPQTGEHLTDFVEVADVGEVVSWCWVSEPRPNHLLQQPFAWAMIRLKGSDVPMLHMVNVPSIEAMHTGMEVRARWAEQRIGRMLDIRFFDAV